MKTCGVPIIGFVGLKFKMYTFITEGNHESKKAKEIKPQMADNVDLRFSGFFKFWATFCAFGKLGPSSSDCALNFK